MRFQTKMIYIYAIFMFAIALVLGVAYYNYNIKQYKTMEKASLKVSADQLIVQCDEMIKPMELTMNYILSDANMLKTIYLLSKQKDGKLDGYVKEAQVKLCLSLNTDFIINNFYRTIVFNKLRCITSSNNMTDKAIKNYIDYQNIPWLLRADENLGTPIIINSHKDTWGLKKNPQIFSLLKAIQGKNMGYIEVQKKIDDLKKLIILPKDDMNCIIFVNGDEMFYTNIPGDISSDYFEVVRQNGEFLKTYRIDGNKKQFIAKSTSNKYDISVLVMENSSIAFWKNGYIIPTTILVAAVFFAISMIFVIMLSYYLAKPIRQLRAVMENTEIDNLGDEVMLKTPNDEIKALSISYQNVLERLRQSMIKEKRMSLLQLQAQFDLLQSQVNPHFLYNVLNVIAARGISNQDEQICEMCGSLAMMLRYSTNTKTQYATIKEELEYLNQYFYLLKARFEHKLNFEVNVEESILSQVIPKITLQQIVENSINHGFENSVNQMNVVVSGWQKEDQWYIKVHDNGQGFSEETLKKLKKKLEGAKNCLLEENENMKLEIGSMGLVNTYARLLLLYHKDLIFEMRNSIEGADVIIVAAMNNSSQKNVNSKNLLFDDTSS